MKRNEFVAVAIVLIAYVALSSSNAATIPAGTTVSISTTSSMTSQDPVGRTFTAQINQDVAVNGKVLLKAGTKATGKIVASRANPRKNTALTLELTAISANGRNVAVKTDPSEPGVPTTTGRQSRRGHTAGTLNVTPGTTMQFRLTRAVTF